MVIKTRAIKYRAETIVLFSLQKKGNYGENATYAKKSIRELDGCYV